MAITTEDSTLDARLTQLQAEFTASNPASERQFSAQAQFMPGANSRSVLFYAPFPLTIARGEGAALWDVDGHRYDDFLAEYTAGVYGHSAPEIRDAVLTAMEGGINLTGHNLLEGQLAKLICERFPQVQQLRFTNSGTEANLMAINAAVHFTKRPKIVVFSGGYHGGVLTFGAKPSPITVPYDFIVLPYNDVAAAEAAFAEQGPQIAAVLVEPMLGAGGCIPAQAEFLHALRRLTTQAGALMMMDEVMTSRLAPHGLAAQHGITPDMTTLGKYIGGGMSFGAFGGRADIMAIFDPRTGSLAHSGTFNNNVVTMAAGLAGLTKLYPPSAAGELAARGQALRERLNAHCAQAGVALQFTGVGSVMNSHFTAQAIARPEDATGFDPRLRQLLFFHLLAHGIYTAPRGLVVLSLPVTGEAISRFEAAVHSFLTTYADLLPR
ncbi:aspartate aminotransferase family protein [Ottowia thiooxydans]|uniref:aspartate aminotransferase family protein n=1 Tax=Ottowia thiooxydans TaxID=219182 RepID=UPI0003FB7CAD|nr:aminotransferase class III-fold pyridoxal phosphate-dependent enzyme [Ottowia thiooxydans]